MEDNTQNADVMSAAMKDMEAIPVPYLVNHVKVENGEVVINVYGKDDPRYNSPFYKWFLVVLRSEYCGTFYRNVRNFSRRTPYCGHDKMEMLETFHKYIVDQRKYPSQNKTVVAQNKLECDLLCRIEQRVAVASGLVDYADEIQRVWTSDDASAKASALTRFAELFNFDRNYQAPVPIYAAMYQAVVQNQDLSSVLTQVCGVSPSDVISHSANVSRLREIRSLFRVGALNPEALDLDLLNDCIGTIDEAWELRNIMLRPCPIEREGEVFSDLRSRMIVCLQRIAEIFCATDSDEQRYLYAMLLYDYNYFFMYETRHRMPVLVKFIKDADLKRRQEEGGDCADKDVGKSAEEAGGNSTEEDETLDDDSYTEENFSVLLYPDDSNIISIHEAEVKKPLFAKRFIPAMDEQKSIDKRSLPDVIAAGYLSTGKRTVCSLLEQLSRVIVANTNTKQIDRLAKELRPLLSGMFNAYGYILACRQMWALLEVWIAQRTGTWEVRKENICEDLLKYWMIVVPADESPDDVVHYLLNIASRSMPLVSHVSDVATQLAVLIMYFPTKFDPFLCELDSY
jgi:hypothetical protein